MIWFILLFLSLILIAIVFNVSTREQNKIIVVDNKPDNEHLVDNVIDYRYYYPYTYYNYYPWAPFGNRMPYFYRVGGSPYRYNKGGRHWRSRYKGTYRPGHRLGGATSFAKDGRSTKN